MDRRAFMASPIGVAAASALSAAETEPQTLRSRLLGVWSLTQAVTVKGDETAPWFGRRPPLTGALIYESNGWMSVQITGAATGTISRADFLKLGAADRAVWLDAYYAYFGTFEVDDAAHTVTHRVLNSLLPYETGAVLKLNVSVEGDRLTALTQPRDDNGVSSFNRLVWKKVA